MEEERLRELREEKEDVTKKTDLSDFYFNLSKNVAFGAGDADKGKHKKSQDVEVQPPGEVPATSTSSESSRMEKRPQDEITEACSPSEKSDKPHTEPISEASLQHQITDEQSTRNQPKPGSEKGSEDQRPDSQSAGENAAASTAKDHHKKSQDALAAAKERFLARKKAKLQ